VSHDKVSHRLLPSSAHYHPSHLLLSLSLPLHPPSYFSLSLPPLPPPQHLDIQVSLNELHRHIYLMFKRVATEMNEKTSKLQQAKLEAMMERTHSNYELGDICAVRPAYTCHRWTDIPLPYSPSLHPTYCPIPRHPPHNHPLHPSPTPSFSPSPLPLPSGLEALQFVSRNLDFAHLTIKAGMHAGPKGEMGRDRMR
jgi:hypothetical protein